MSTPLEALDDAIHQFLADTVDNGAILTGWVVGIETSRIDPNPDTNILPRRTGARYVLGPQTSLVQLSGLSTYLQTVAEAAMWDLDDEDDDE